MHIANINEAKTHLSRLLNQALAGEEIVIARAGHPLVRLTPVAHEAAPRQAPGGGRFRCARPGNRKALLQQ